MVGSSAASAAPQFHDPVGSWRVTQTRSALTLNPNGTKSILMLGDCDGSAAMASEPKSAVADVHNPRRRRDSAPKPPATFAFHAAVAAAGHSFREVSLR